MNQTTLSSIFSIALVTMGLILPIKNYAATTKSTAYTSANNGTVTHAESAITLNGVTDFVQFTNVTQLSENFTISTWIKPTGSNKQMTILNLSSTTGSFSIELTDDNAITVTYPTTQGNVTVTSNSFLSMNVWREVNVTYNGTKLDLYIDGILDQTITTQLAAPAAYWLTIGATRNGATYSKNFTGSIDEVRIWNTALTLDQSRFIMNQELENVDGKVLGTVTKNYSSVLDQLSWDDLEGYYTFNSFIDLAPFDKSNKANHAVAIITTTNQTTPLPYTTATAGYWEEDSTWTQANQAHLPNSNRLINGSLVKVDWNIVRTKHNISVGFATTLLALDVQEAALTVTNDESLTVSSYLKIDGVLDLENESQLLQTEQSVVDTQSTGTLERDQQGSGNIYNYNYWSSPVSFSNATAANSGYTVEGVMMDGTDTFHPRNLNFTSTDQPNGMPAQNGNAATVSTRWMYKYSNLASGTYSNWQHVGKDGELKAGEGYSMKGTGCGGEQNYTFKGLPNNGEIQLPSHGGNDYLIGNPYPSAIDAVEFIKDNPHLDGTVYFWEHQGGETHNVDSYVGGYSMYNLSGGVPNVTMGSGTAIENENGTATKMPGRYIPVAQGFFVIVKDDAPITFKNSQRVFKKESAGHSVFTAAPGSTNAPDQTFYNADSDSRPKIRLGFDSANGIHRQILLTVDPNATLGLDNGYDGLQFDDQIDDMSFLTNNKRLSIQGIGEVDGSVTLPLFVKLKDHGFITIGLDHFENLDADQPVYIKDNTTGKMTNLREEKFRSPFIYRGDHKGRFSVVFHGKETLSTSTVETTNEVVVYTPDSSSIAIKAPQDLQLDQAVLINMLGQVVQTFDLTDSSNDIVLSRSGIASGAYVLQMSGVQQQVSRKIVLQ